MTQQDILKEYKRLYEQYKEKSDEELSEIINPQNSYSKIAQKVASDILNSDRTEYYEKIKKKQTQNVEINISDLLLDIRNDIHSIKNIMKFYFILTIIGLVIGYFIFIASITL